MSISLEQIKHLAHLSRLEFSEEELKEMKGDIGNEWSPSVSLDPKPFPLAEPHRPVNGSNDC